MHPLGELRDNTPTAALAATRVSRMNLRDRPSTDIRAAEGVNAKITNADFELPNGSYLPHTGPSLISSYA